jgi:hypothetical protein
VCATTMMLGIDSASRGFTSRTEEERAGCDVAAVNCP